MITVLVAIGLLLLAGSALTEGEIFLAVVFGLGAVALLVTSERAAIERRRRRRYRRRIW